MPDLLSMCRSMGLPSWRPSSVASRPRWTASLPASEAATISASHEESATVFCFFDPQETAARFNTKTFPEVEWRVAQSESVSRVGHIE
jgi:hypothetical protein